jgi:dihydrofolate reductase
MRKLVQFMHVSLDGFVAGPNGEMNWILVDDEMFESAGVRTNKSDTALYFRVTFEMMEGYWPTAADQPNASKHDIEHSKWYNKVKKVVVSRTLKGKSFKNTTIISDNVTSEIQKLKEGQGSEIIIFGSPSASHLLLDAGLIDDLWLFVNPILLGKGIPLFKGIREQINLKLTDNKVYKSGVVSLHYERLRK